MDQVISLTEFFWAWGLGPTGAMATAGEVIALSMPAADATWPGAETVVVDVARRTYAAATVAVAPTHLLRTVQPRAAVLLTRLQHVAAAQEVALLMQRLAVARRMAAHMHRQVVAAHTAAVVDHMLGAANAADLRHCSGLRNCAMGILYTGCPFVMFDRS